MFVLVCAVLLFVEGGQTEHSEVAFSAGLSQDLVLQHAEHVVFDKMYTNFGSGYDSSTGTFNCPTSGIYVFEFNMMAQQDKSSWLELYHNAYYVVSAYAHAAKYYGNAGNSVILTLAKGDQVYLRAVDSGFGAATHMYGRVNEVYSSFSGYMVSPIFIDAPGK